jgi:hypothetical protein
MLWVFLSLLCSFGKICFHILQVFIWHTFAKCLIHIKHWCKWYVASPSSFKTCASGTPLWTLLALLFKVKAGSGLGLLDNHMALITSYSLLFTGLPLLLVYELFDARGIEVFFLLQIHMLKSQLPVWCIRRWGIPEIIRMWRCTTYAWISALRRRNVRIWLHLCSPSCEDAMRWENSHLKTWEAALARTWAYWNLTLPASRIMKNKCLIFELHSMWYTAIVR